MEHVAIDLGGRESQICVRDANEAILEERRMSTRRIGEYLARRPPSRVIVETSAEAFAIADAARAAGHEVRVVPAMLVRALGVGARGVKTDRRDAQALSAVSCRVDLKSVHIPSAQAREWRTLCTARDALVRARTLLVNNVKSQLRGRLVSNLPRVSGRFSERMREKFVEVLREVPPAAEPLLNTVEELSSQIADATREVAARAKGSEVCRKLMTVPGVGPVTSVRFAAALDDVMRFKTAHEVQSYLGLTPGENSSSDRVRRTHLTKAGSPSVRWVLVQAAWTAMRTRASDPMVLWAREIGRRRGRGIAVVALARKLAGILFAIWRDGSTYDPRRGAAPPA